MSYKLNKKPITVLGFAGQKNNSKAGKLKLEKVREKIADAVYDLSGSDLDVPGSELDDAQEEIGSEDEENNLYSLGGDNHEN
ncbi:MAG TPA: hypothetical protein P5084_09475 [Paludibacter sp.]|nr:hypothetical protein [Paludibacter sp.]